MRRLVNAYGAHLGRLFEGDPFDLAIGLAELTGLFLLAITLVTLTMMATIEHFDSGHRSCAVEHMEGKVMVCDSYYPAPRLAR